MKAVLFICCLALALVITYEWEHPVDPLRSQARVQPDPGHAPKPVTVPPLSFSPPSAYSEVAARPLFLTSRRQPAEDGVKADGVRASPARYVLSGVSISPAGTLAILWDTRKRKFVRATVGEKLDGWRVEAVKADQVTLSHNDKKLDLKIKWGGSTEGGMPHPLPRSRAQSQLENSGRYASDKGASNAGGLSGAGKGGSDGSARNSDGHGSQSSQGSGDTGD